MICFTVLNPEHWLFWRTPTTSTVGCVVRCWRKRKRTRSQKFPAAFRTSSRQQSLWGWMLAWPDKHVFVVWTNEQRHHHCLASFAINVMFAFDLSFFTLFAAHWMWKLDLTETLVLIATKTELNSITVNHQDFSFSAKSKMLGNSDLKQRIAFYPGLWVMAELLLNLLTLSQWSIIFANPTCLLPWSW